VGLEPPRDFSRKHLNGKQAVLRGFPAFIFLILFGVEFADIPRFSV
jgi:hypothetical protein